MQIPKQNDREYLEKQYRDASKLKSRLNLHQRFSVNKYGWHHWLFDQIDLPPACRILELGCGPGTLWSENFDRIPSGWEITLSDFSSGMLEEARRNLEKRRFFRFEVVDAQFIPFESGHFDAVIANHMLYHVPDRQAAFSEIRRVLKPAGHFYASTIGDRHLGEIAVLLTKFDSGLASWLNTTDSFTLENGMAQLSQWFAEIKLCRYQDAFIVTEAAPLIDYILSGRVNLEGTGRNQFEDFVVCEMESHGGTLQITKDSGLFVSVRKGD